MAGVSHRPFVFQLSDLSLNDPQLSIWRDARAPHAECGNRSPPPRAKCECVLDEAPLEEIDGREHAPSQAREGRKSRAYSRPQPDSRSEKKGQKRKAHQAVGRIHIKRRHGGDNS